MGLTMSRRNQSRDLRCPSGTKNIGTSSPRKSQRSSIRSIVLATSSSVSWGSPMMNVQAGKTWLSFISPAACTTSSGHCEALNGATLPGIAAVIMRGEPVSTPTSTPHQDCLSSMRTSAHFESSFGLVIRLAIATWLQPTCA